MFCLYMSQVENCISQMKILNKECQDFQVRNSNTLLNLFSWLFQNNLSLFFYLCKGKTCLSIGLNWLIRMAYLDILKTYLSIEIPISFRFQERINLENIRFQFYQLLSFPNNYFVWEKSIFQEGGIETIDMLCLLGLKSQVVFWWLC